MARGRGCQVAIPIDFSYCCSWFGLLKLIELLSTFLAAVCIPHGICYFWCSGNDYHTVGAHGQPYVLTVVVLALLTSLILLLINALRLTKTRLKKWPWLNIELGYYLFICICLIPAFIMELFYTVGMHYYKQYSHAAWAAATVFIGVAFVTYSVDLWIVLLRMQLNWPALWRKLREHFAVEDDVDSNSSDDICNNPVSDQHPPQTVTQAHRPTTAARAHVVKFSEPSSVHTIV